MKYLSQTFIKMGFILYLFSPHAFAMGNEEDAKPKSAMIIKENGKVIVSSGPCEERHAPFSTFKIALSFMGFQEGFFQDKDSPTFPFKEEYETRFQNWYTRAKGEAYGWCQSHTPTTFMRHSVVWVSHLITQFLGAEKFQKYVSTFHYGNEDISGTPGEHDGLFNSWLGTSLEISPLEQVCFIEALCLKSLGGLYSEAQEKTKEVMDREEEWDGWKLYGKTGGGHGNNGWFVGWIEKDERRITLAHYLDLDDPNLILPAGCRQNTIGLTAKEHLKRKVLNHLNSPV